MRSTLRTPKVAAFAGAALLAWGGVAAAVEGVLPTPVQRVAHTVLGSVVPDPDHRARDQDRGPRTRGATVPGATSSTTLSPGNGQGPDATAAAKFGLCTAYFAGQATTNGDKARATAFRALAAAAGGADKIAEFCKDASPGKPGSTDDTGSGRPPPTGTPGGGSGHAPEGGGERGGDASRGGGNPGGGSPDGGSGGNGGNGHAPSGPAGPAPGSAGDSFGNAHGPDGR